jgi:hypothetical protein
MLKRCFFAMCFAYLAVLCIFAEVAISASECMNEVSFQEAEQGAKIGDVYLLAEFVAILESRLEQGGELCGYDQQQFLGLLKYASADINKRLVANKTIDYESPAASAHLVLIDVISRMYLNGTAGFKPNPAMATCKDFFGSSIPPSCKVLDRQEFSLITRPALSSDWKNKALDQSIWD